MLPPESLPSASGTAPAATATADPVDEPPAARSGSRGLRVGPCAGLSSSAVVMPTTTAPAARMPRDCACVALRPPVAVLGRRAGDGPARDVDPVLDHDRDAFQRTFGPTRDAFVGPSRLRARSLRIERGDCAEFGRRTDSSRPIASCTRSTAVTSRVAQCAPDRVDGAGVVHVRPRPVGRRGRRSTGGARRRAAPPARASRRLAGGRRPRRRARTARCTPCARRRWCCVPS